MNKNTIFEQFLAPIFGNFLIDWEQVKDAYRDVNWEQESDRLTNPQLVYPEYYKSQNFHGIKNGYLNRDAAMSYDPITQYVVLPNETWVRQGLVDRIQGQPQRILDLGCGTGSTTLLLKQKFTTAQVIGLDLSPYMLVTAAKKAKNANLTIEWRQGKAEQTGFPDAFFDVVTASLLFHETPPDITQAILQEGFRLLKPGGQMIIFDGNQKTLFDTQWLTEIFEEPYIKTYAGGNLNAMLEKAGFGAVGTEDWWWIHQISQGVKPLTASKTSWTVEASELNQDLGYASPA